MDSFAEVENTSNTQQPISFKDILKRNDSTTANVLEHPSDDDLKEMETFMKGAAPSLVSPDEYETYIFTKILINSSFYKVWCFGCKKKKQPPQSWSLFCSTLTVYKSTATIGLGKSNVIFSSFQYYMILYFRLQQTTNLLWIPVFQISRLN